MTTTTEPETSTQPEPAPKPRSLRRRVLSRISIQSKLLVMLLVTSILSAAVVGAIGYQSGRSSLRASVFDRLTEIRGSQSRQLEAQVQRPEELAGRLHPRRDDDRGDRGVHRRLRPAQQRHDQPGAMAVDRRLLQQPIRAVRRASRPATKSMSSAVADVERPEIPAGQLHGAVHRLGQGDRDSTTPATAAPGRPPTPGYNDFFREIVTALRVRGRAAARHPRQRRLQRVQGRRSRHQHPHRPLPRRRTARRLREGAGLQRRRLRRRHRLRRLPARRRAHRLDGVAGRPAGPGGRRAGPAVPDLQDQPADDRWTSSGKPPAWARPARRSSSGPTT